MPCVTFCTRFKDYTKEPYKAGVGNGYEPWFIINRLMSPFYDQRFRGYGNDKISHVFTVNATGFGFMVHPSSFIVHRPHPKSKAFFAYVTRKQAARRALRQAGPLAQQTDAAGQVPSSPATQDYASLTFSLRALTESMWRDAREQLAQGTYTTLVDDAVQACRQQLPWWGLGSGTSGVGDASAAEEESESGKQGV